jgi:hypothetical protein
MEKIVIQIAGPETPCDRCKKTRQIIEQILQEKSVLEASIEHIVLTDKATIEKYGVLKGPAVIINEVLVSEGEVPNPNYIVKALEQILVH